MSDELYARFEALRRDTMYEPVAEPAVLRAAAERRRWIRRGLGVGVAVVAAVAAVSVASLAAPSALPPTANSPSATPPSPPPAPASSPPSAPPSTPPSSPAPSSAASPSTCRAAGLRLGTFGGDGFAGGGVNGLGLTNTSDRTCKLSGFVRLQLVDSAGRALPTDVHRTGTARTVTLRPGATAYFGVTQYNVPVPDNEGAPCEPPAAALLVTPSSGDGSLRLPGPFRACGGGRLELGPLMPEPDPNWHN